MPRLQGQCQAYLLRRGDMLNQASLARRDGQWGSAGDAGRTGASLRPRTWS
jgi:hypothetical protein